MKIDERCFRAPQTDPVLRAQTTELFEKPPGEVGGNKLARPASCLGSSGLLWTCWHSFSILSRVFHSALNQTLRLYITHKTVWREKCYVFVVMGCGGRKQNQTLTWLSITESHHSGVFTAADWWLQLCRKEQMDAWLCLMTLITLSRIIMDETHFTMLLHLTPERDNKNVCTAVLWSINPFSAYNRAAPTDCFNHSIMGLLYSGLIIYTRYRIRQEGK